MATRGELVCATCGGVIPESMWSAKDETGEQEEMARDGVPHRSLYDSVRCMRAGTPSAYEEEK